jgi:hypothetical protein
MSDSEYSDDYSDDEGIIQENVVDNNYKMTTNGLSATNSYKFTSDLEKYSICDVCNRYFYPELIDNTDKEFQKCIHCQFWMMYSEINSGSILEENVKRLEEYYEKCLDEHENTTCARNSESCLLCEAKIGLFPSCILEYRKAQEAVLRSKEDENIVSFGGAVDIADIGLGKKLIKKEPSRRIILEI